jgi:hypothetical protein
VALSVVAATVLILRPLSTRLGWAHVPAVALIACFTCAAGLGAATHDLDSSVRLAREHTRVDTASARYVSNGEQRAALWLNAHSDPDDIVATNVFCVPTRYRPSCRHAAFWVAALTGRQLLIGSWGYTEQNLKNYGRGGTVRYQRLPSPWPDRVALSLAAVRSPNPATMAALKRRGVRWIFADRRATAISPNLDKYATLEYRNADVMVFRLGR